MENNGMMRMEGWVYILNPSKLRLNHPRKRYLVLVGNRASAFKDKSRAKDEVLHFIFYFILFYFIFSL